MSLPGEQRYAFSLLNTMAGILSNMQLEILQPSCSKFFQVGHGMTSVGSIFIPQWETCGMNRYEASCLELASTSFFFTHLRQQENISKLLNLCVVNMWLIWPLFSPQIASWFRSSSTTLGDHAGSTERRANTSSLAKMMPILCAKHWLMLIPCKQPWCIWSSRQPVRRKVWQLSRTSRRKSHVEIQRLFEDTVEGGSM